jgi:Type IV secretory system Conjugative DNA transfer
MLSSHLEGRQFTWPHSAFVTDLKREIYELTAGWRGTEGNNRILAIRAGKLDPLRCLQPP